MGLVSCVLIRLKLVFEQSHKALLYGVWCIVSQSDCWTIVTRSNTYLSLAIMYIGMVLLGSMIALHRCYLITVQCSWTFTQP